MLSGGFILLFQKCSTLVGKTTYHGEIDLLDCIDIARFYQVIIMIKAPNYLTKCEEKTGNLLGLTKNNNSSCPQSLFSQEYQ